MNKNLKRVLFATGMATAMLLTGCSKTEEKPPEKEKQTESDDGVVKRGAYTTKKEPTATEADAPLEKTKTVGDFEVTLKSATTNPVVKMGDTQLTPDDGCMFVRTDFKVKNNSNQTFTGLGGGADFFITADEDETKKAYIYMLGEIEDATRLEGQLNPNEEKEGYIVWCVPEDFKELNVDFIPDLMDKASAEFTINR